MESECWICGATENLVADHDHDTDEFRGTLCRLCNSGIGMLGDSSERVARAALYLER